MDESCQGRPTLDIHPLDAAARDIADGALIRVYNDRGSCQRYARFTGDVRPGVVVSQGLRWRRNTIDGCGVNATTPQRLADLDGGATFFTNGVEVEPVANPATRNGTATLHVARNVTTATVTDGS